MAGGCSKRTAWASTWLSHTAGQDQVSFSPASFYFHHPHTLGLTTDYPQLNFNLTFIFARSGKKYSPAALSPSKPRAFDKLGTNIYDK